jgi:thiol:disulfide interchange protein DsbD
MRNHLLSFIFIFICSLLATPMSIAANESTAVSNNPLDALSSLFSGSYNTASDELLEPDQAFNFYADVDENQQITLNWRLADGYYLYQEKVNVTLTNPQGIQLKPINFPIGKQKTDEIYGATVVYYTDLTLIQPLATPLSTATEITLSVDFQGCADIGVCYPPMNKVVTLSLQPTTRSGIDNASSVKPAQLSEQDDIANALIGNAIWLTCLTFLGFGILLSLTPCVFPMIPILSGIIVGHGKDLTTRKAFYLSLSYVVASALTYALFGVLAGLFGSNLQATFQNPWILSAFSGVFVLLALSMFGLYDLQLPNAIQSKLSNISQHQKHGSLWGSAIMGVLSTLIVGPCVAAPLAGVLIYIGQTGDAALGGFALFSLGLGMGIPLIIIGISAGKLLPKAGHWMEPIKHFFGVLLLAVAIWLMERILPPAVVLGLSAGLLIICAIYFKAIDRLSDNATGWQKFSKGLGVIFLIYGIILMLGAASGGSNPLKPLANLGLAQQSNSQQHGLAFQTIKNIDELNAALASASQNEQFVMLDFYADWCASCKEMEAYTFTDPAVQQALKNVVLLQADVTKNDDEDRALLNAFSLIGPPAILFFNTQTEELTRQRAVGYMESAQFLAKIEALK